MKRHQKEFEQYYQDWLKYDKPWELWEIRFRKVYDDNNFTEWETMHNESVHYFGSNNVNFRRKPETIKIGDYELPKPITEKPEEEKLVYFFTPKDPRGFIHGRYCEHSEDVNYFNNRCIHLTEEAVLEWVNWWKETVINKL